MKAKIKFDQQAVNGFFIQHCEKLVLGLIVLVFLGMAWSALTRESYAKSPSQLRQIATDARSRIDNTDPKRLPAPEIVDYRKEAEDGQKFIASVQYEWKHPWNPAIFPKPKKRFEPKLLPVEQLAGTADFGAFALRAGEGAGEDRGQRWVVITGLVPVAQQVEAYNEALKGIPRPETDTPKYYSYAVQRAEVFGDSRDANPAWTPLDLRAAYAPMASWTSAQVDAVAPRYVSEKLVFPLGPLSSKSWDSSVAHPPEIPLAAETAAMPGRDESGVAPPGASVAPAGPGAGIVAEGVGPPGARGPRPDGSTVVLAEGQKHLLFRFFDFSVQPGKRYRYQAKLYLENPNYKYEPRHNLASPDLAKEQVIETEWCEATKPIHVQRDDRLLAGPVKPAIRPYMEPVATLTLVKWMADRGVQHHNKFEGIHGIYRGQLLNLSGAGPAAEGDAPAEPVLGELAPKPTPGVKKPQTLYRTDALLLDVQGGERSQRFPSPDKQPDKQTEPSYLLILDHDNTLVIHGELEDEAILTKLTATHQAGAEGEGGMVAPVTAKGAAAGTAKTKAGGAAKKGAAAGIVEEPTGGLFGGDSGKKKKK